jgi:hypothetical protein
MHEAKVPGLMLMINPEGLLERQRSCVQVGFAKQGSNLRVPHAIEASSE